MTTSSSPIDPAADARATHALLQARRPGQAADASAVSITNAAQAYRVQDQVAQALGWFGGQTPRHCLSGCPVGDAVLTHARLPPEGVWSSPADARSRHFHWCGIEAEIALRLGQAVTPALAQDLTPLTARGLVDAMAVAIEIVDSRWAQGQQAPAWHRLADLQSHGALVLGEWQPMRPVDWAIQRCVLQIGPQTWVFTGTHSLSDPTWLLPQWLRHATQHGAVLPAGSVVTTGTWCGLPLAQAGDAVQVHFEGIGEARVQF